MPFPGKERRAGRGDSRTQVSTSSCAKGLAYEVKCQTNRTVDHCAKQCTRMQQTLSLRQPLEVASASGVS